MCPPCETASTALNTLGDIPVGCQTRDPPWEQHSLGNALHLGCCQHLHPNLSLEGLEICHSQEYFEPNSSSFKPIISHCLP